MRSLDRPAVNGASRAAAAVIASAALFACGAVAPGFPATGSPDSTSTGHLTVATESDDGKTVALHVGDRLEVRLNSTYWTVNDNSNAQVLHAVGPAVVSPQPSGCVPGAGCGTVIALFDVVGAGSADVTASRNSCGEAMGCTGNQGSYRVTIVATA